MDEPKKDSIETYLSAVRYFRLSSAPAPLKYFFAFLVATAALGTQFLVKPWFGSITHFLLFPAVFISMSIVGVGPGCFTIMLCALGADYFFVAPTGQVKIFSDQHSFARFLLFAGTSFVAAWFVSRNLAAERKLAEELMARKIALQAHDDFLSVASHELRTPLTSLKLQTQHLTREIKKGDLAALSFEKLSAFGNQAEKQIGRLERLISDMLDVSRITSGHLSFEPEAMDLSEMTKDLLERMRNLFLENGSAPELHANAAVVGTWDKLRMEQVVLNLFTNAIRYGKNKPVQVFVSQKDGNAILEVRDQGIGIALENLERVFERFERAVDSNEASGLGLGLFISRQIVNAHGGKIWARSALGQGSSFFVELPLTGHLIANATH
jgi:signal transduction histidine kinase